MTDLARAAREASAQRRGRVRRAGSSGARRPDAAPAARASRCCSRTAPRTTGCRSTTAAPSLPASGAELLDAPGRRPFRGDRSPHARVGADRRAALGVPLDHQPLEAAREEDGLALGSSPAGRRPGRRSSSSGSTVFSSSRASGAPMQKWIPLPNARCRPEPVPLRVDAVGAGEDALVAVRRAEVDHHARPVRQLDAAESPSTASSRGRAPARATRAGGSPRSRRRQLRVEQVLARAPDGGRRARARCRSPASP